jgi:hypothetical protein
MSHVVVMLRIFIIYAGKEIIVNEAEKLDSLRGKLVE